VRLKPLPPPREFGRAAQGTRDEVAGAFISKAHRLNYLS
jgi:hypothetical protein